MKFSTETIEKVAKILTEELEKTETSDQGIMELENDLREVLQVVGEKTMSRYLSREEKEPESREIACSCGGQAKYHSKRTATVISVFGKVQYKRSYFRCPDCQKGKSPRDEQMGIVPGAVTAGLARLIGLIGVETAYEEASRMVKELLLIEISDNTIRKETEQFGKIQAEIEKSWEEKSQDENGLQTRLREIGPQKGRLYGSIDGAIVPLKGEWRELKCAAWYKVDKIASFQKKRHHKKKSSW